jgi:hypothetical protein
MRDTKIFDEAVMAFFEPIARRLALPLLKVRDGVYEIPSPHFIMRVRLDTGHRRGFNVILRPASAREFDENKPGIQYGIGAFMQLYGEGLEQTFINVDSDEDFLKRAQLLAQTAERYGVPYLLGQGKDWEAVREMVSKKTAADLEEIGKYRFPNNVRKEWI